MESEHERKRREFYLEMSDAAFEDECRQLREDLKGFKLNHPN